MKHKLLIILTITTLKVVGQNQFVGVKGGVNMTNITSSNFLIKTESRIGLTAGLTYEYLFKKDFSIGADLIYNQRGFTNEVVFNDNLGNPTGDKSKTKFNYDYVSLPLKTGYNFGTKLFGFTNIGVIPSLLVNAKMITPTVDPNGKVTGSETFDVTNRVSKFDLAGLIEVGGGYKFNGRYWLFTSFSYQHSFTSITNADYFAGSKIRNNGMALTIGLKCALTKE